jgi:hypothetical protein
MSSQRQGIANVSGMYTAGPFNSRPPKGHMSVSRVDALNKKNQRRTFVRSMLEKYDVSRSGGLRWDEIKAFVKDLDPAREEATEVGPPLCAARSRLPACTWRACTSLFVCQKLRSVWQDELRWLIQMSTPDHQKFNGEWKSGKFSLQREAIAGEVVNGRSRSHFGHL